MLSPLEYWAVSINLPPSTVLLCVMEWHASIKRHWSMTNVTIGRCMFVIAITFNADRSKAGQKASSMTPLTFVMTDTRSFHTVARQNAQLQNTQGRNGVRLRPGQETSLAPLMFEPRVFRKHMCCWREYLWHYLGLFDPSAVIRRLPQWFGAPMVIRYPGGGIVFLLSSSLHPWKHRILPGTLLVATKTYQRVLTAKRN